ncbi:MAG: co-chaperone GroES [SAR324 cluster bacterium]|uniref:Co-chaperone GroES n=1 Tax=SAR324 cluster bacterium TaxID=2024889 RepID=A0A7X9FQZ2_9DELT|nr:co-chaperone GroES [SAR324 cluster bacterium]
MNPLGFRVVISILNENDMTEGGLYLPEGAKQNMNESLLARVIEVASATDQDSDEEHNISGIPLGATVLIAKNSGIKVPWDEKLRIVNSKDILALVEEVSVI